MQGPVQPIFKTHPHMKSDAERSQRLRQLVLSTVRSIPKGKFSTYGLIAKHLKLAPRQVATVLGHLTSEEAEALPWHRVVAADARLSPNLPEPVALEQRKRLLAEGLALDAKGYIQDPDGAFHLLR
jgi:methylated-DNA-protein-cysteine methyltransferase related protein